MEEEAKPRETVPGRRRVRTSWLVGGAVIALVVIALFWRYTAVRESTDDAQIDGRLTPLAARVGGTVAAIRFDDNQAVEAGTLLVQLDTHDTQVALDRAKADLAGAEAALAAARIDVPMTATNTASAVQAAESDRQAAEAAGHSADARQRQAAARDAKAAQDLERLKHLHENDEISDQEYDAAALAAASARAESDGATASVHEAEQRVMTAQARLRQAGTAPQQVAITRARAAAAEARVQQARAAVARAELDLAYTAVTAPVSGVVTKRSIEVGEIVQPGQPLLSIVPLDDIWVTANFKESQLRNIRPGQAVRISVDAYGGRTYRGRVASLSPATGSKFSLLPPENATGNYVKVVQRVPIKIVLEPGQNSDHRLRPGMSVEPTVFLR